MPATPLSVDLSRLLLAFTIELDNEFEHRMAAALPERRPFRVSLVMWSNCLRFVGDGIGVSELPVAAGLPKPRVLSTLGGMERWGYVYVASGSAGKAPTTKRDGYGSARALKPEWTLRPTAVGVAAQKIWPPLFTEIEARWSSRFAAERVAELRGACLALIAEPQPEYLPIVVGTTGMVSEIADDRPRPTEPRPLSALLAQVLLSYTLEFERDAPLSLPLAENVVRVLGEEELDVRELPGAGAVSPEGIAMALTFLRKRGYVDGTKLVRLTKAGASARDESQSIHARVERSWTERYGHSAIDRLRSATGAILEQRDGTQSRLALGLEPYPEGWRASGRYLAQTEAMLADPAVGIPRHPMVLHRGGWPDGS